MFSVTENPAFDLFIMQSQEYLNKVMEAYGRSPYKYIDIILEQCGVTRADFTDPDWKVISQYLDREGDHIG